MGGLAPRSPLWRHPWKGCLISLPLEANKNHTEKNELSNDFSVHEFRTFATIIHNRRFSLETSFFKLLCHAIGSTRPTYTVVSQFEPSIIRSGSRESATRPGAKGR
ncbi:hypothetical protein AVEN_49023-1 [Araneus ventricosus]|uniref:Uncharacterized protein n=1 Tax=Araneus ventricosus TaxID=182803 RepID=A0A4Y2AJG4_ARAVE|nr:hypothetical protein AVEN_49023-1 [Araneus ventricosus]